MLKSNYERFGVECGDGWKNILQPIFDYIEKYNNIHDEKIEVLQVKEKFGGLRFYTNFHTEELKELIKHAEDESYVTCELCGSKENIGHTLGWITTCCIECAKNMSIKHNRIVRWKPIKENNEHKWLEINKDNIKPIKD